MTTIRWVDSVDAVDPAVWAACFRPPLEGRWWYAALEAAGIGDQFTFAYGVIERDGRAVGLVPTFLMDVPLDVIAPDRLAAAVRLVGRAVRFLRYQRTLFVGSPCADEGSVGLAEGVSLADVADDVQAAVDGRAAEARASMIVWKDFADADGPALNAMAARRGLFRVTSYPGTRVPLPGGGYEGYLRSLSSSHRHNLKKKVRVGGDTLATTAAVVQRPDAATLDELWPLFWQTYLKGRTKFERLTPAFFAAVAADAAAHFVLLRDGGGRLRAFMLCFDCRPRAVNKFIGLDYGAGDRAYLYFQLWRAAVAWAADAGFEEFQSGQTGYRAKLDVGHRLVPLTNYARHRNRLVHRLFAWQARGIGWRTIDADLAHYMDAHTEVRSP